MLALNQVTKRFGQTTAVDAESFTVAPGEILGLIGQNGAGKTTTFRMILDFLKPTTGTIQWAGEPIARLPRSAIGYLPEERGLYPKMTVQAQVLYFAELHGMRRPAALAELRRLMAAFAVKGKPSDKLQTLSKGNQQKIQLIAAIIHRPKLLILDEPFSGLDPVNADLLIQGVRALQAGGCAIIFSSHDMHNVTALSDRIVMLRNGQTVLAGTQAEIAAQFGRTNLTIESPLTQAELAAFPGVAAVVPQGSGFAVTLRDPAAGRAIFAAATKDGYIPRFVQAAPSLEAIFKLKAGDHHA
ncbi:ABC transporter ATP-binding protein [Lacticaseibacillus parakribbianus]|uniref:ABC transporter ATP-binding protein n=1 Tax=Lacticaseibacillus parakribbianus TaxID=2970927 RepID=UPI0021CB667D|nr:ATP-binding cassette domain-containing protein [Lacticaseibacillus parakribbianus]